MELQARKEIEHIRTMTIGMATLAEEAVHAAIGAFLARDAKKGREVVGKDGAINALEMEIDKAVFECLALKAPVASDLRLLFSMQKMNKDLERIGDHAVNIAQSAINCSGFGKLIASPDIKVMAAITQCMFSDSVTCFIQADTQLALKVLENDDQVDDLNRAMTREVIDMAQKDITSIETALELLRVSKNLERIADLATNIAEDVIFQAQARDVKHHHMDAPVQGAGGELTPPPPVSGT
jgi:phosphate transport system protein